MPCFKPTFKIAIMLLLAGDVSINPGPATSRSMKFSITNVQSVRVKTSDSLFWKKKDIFAITETWPRPHDTAACIADISPSGYTFHQRSRSVGRGGGVGFLLSYHFKVNSYLIRGYSTFEHISVEIAYSRLL